MKKAGFKNIISAAFGIVLLLSIFVFAEEINAISDTKKDLLDMSLEELMEVPIETSGSLTTTDRRINPSTTTTITKEQVQSSGARSLDELLDIYVPNLQTLRDRFEMGHLGLRGINSDRDDKYLLLVNGREMNEHTHYGAISERDLPMLTDIHHVDIIRGPGSAMYGAGAIAMVINIITENYRTFQGTQVTTRVGTIEEFYSTEVKHGKKLTDDSGYFIYAGTTKYDGSDENYSDFHKTWGDLAGYRGYPEREDRTQPDDRRGWRDLPKHKFFAEYDNGNFTSWIRYTRGGEYVPTRWTQPLYSDSKFYGEGYQQVSALLGYKQEITDTLDIDYTFNFDMVDFERQYKSYIQSHREDGYFGQIIARWTPKEEHSFALGGAISREIFGKKSPGYPNQDPAENIFWQNYIDTLPQWYTTTLSLFGEYQWKINPYFTAFLGSRLDNHTYTSDMYSPRFSLVYAPNEKDTLKFTCSRSVKMGHDAEMRVTHQLTDKLTSPEKLTTYELRYERQHTKNFWFGGSLFFNDYDIIGYDGSTEGANALGNVKSFGAELEATYKNNQLKITASHGYTQLLNFQEAEGVSSYVSSEPYGYGKDFANWNNHVSKLTVDYKATDKLTLNSSVRVYWGIPGAEDYASFLRDTDSADGYDDYPDNFKKHYFFTPSVFLNLGMQYDFAKNLTMRIDGHNLLGFFDSELNKTMYGYDYGFDFRSAAPAFTVTLKYDF
jgi:outer membrane receptor for ferrienterochelin and colicin